MNFLLKGSKKKCYILFMCESYIKWRKLSVPYAMHNIYCSNEGYNIL